MTWAVDLHTGANTWISQVKFPDPDSAELGEDVISTSEVQRSIDGSQVVTQPERTYNLEPIMLNWSLRYRATGSGITFNTVSLKERVENYIKSGSGLKLTTHTGKDFVGQFTRMSNRWRLSGSTQKYDVSAEFQQLDVEMLRDQQW